MKVFLCIVVLAVAAAEISEEQKANWKKWSEECQSSTGVSQEAITNLRNNHFEVTDPKILDHVLCFSKKAGLSDAAGNVQVEVVRERLGRLTSDQEEINRIVAKCTVQKASKEQTAYDVFRCLRENKPKFSPV